MWQGRENPGLSLVHAECRASLCRLDLDLDGTRSAEESFHTLLHHIPWSGQSFVQVTEGEAPQVVIDIIGFNQNGIQLSVTSSI
jgi:hypothetical protein